MGMSLVVNEPAPPSPNTLEAYQLAAAKTNVSIAAPQVGGGVFVSRNSSSPTGSGTATASAPSSTATSTGYGSGGYSNSHGYGYSGSYNSNAPRSYTGAASTVRSGHVFAFAGAILFVVALL